MSETANVDQADKSVIDEFPQVLRKSIRDACTIVYDAVTKNSHDPRDARAIEKDNLFNASVAQSEGQDSLWCVVLHDADGVAVYGLEIGVFPESCLPPTAATRKDAIQYIDSWWSEMESKFGDADGSGNLLSVLSITIVSNLIANADNTWLVKQPEDEEDPDSIYIVVKFNDDAQSVHYYLQLLSEAYKVTNAVPLPSARH